MAAAGEYPAGTVRLVTESNPEAIAEQVDSLIRSPSDRRCLSEAAHRFAAHNSFDHLARELLAVVTPWLH
jgi:UDP-N-acetylglucosamine:LPS N-acetylglucosamine transferase